MFIFFSADILIAVMFLGQHEKEVFNLWFLCEASNKNFFAGDLGEGGTKDQECAGRRKRLCTGVIECSLYVDLVQI